MNLQSGATNMREKATGAVTGAFNKIRSSKFGVIGLVVVFLILAVALLVTILKSVQQKDKVGQTV